MFEDDAYKLAELAVLMRANYIAMIGGTGPGRGRGDRSFLPDAFALVKAADELLDAERAKKIRSSPTPSFPMPQTLEP